MFCSVAIDPSIDIRALDVPVNAVATAFKQFLIDLSESLIPSCLQEELIEAASESNIIYTLSCTFFSLGLFPSSGFAGMVEYHSSTLSYPVNPPPLTLHFPPLLHDSFLLVFCLPLRLFPGTGPGASNILLSMCPSSFLSSCPYHFSLFSVIFFVTRATFTDLLTCSFLIFYLSLCVLHCV